MNIIMAIRDFADGFARGLGIYLTEHHDPRDVRYSGYNAVGRERG